ncbi:peroxiredoxin (alkyl hydroperoxide reductase subunit C) [Ekhidna lutea]|uniref:Thioredoxin peroxidase n=1 Tax=Ekhidna lutea TaxID=447679 RepID=A0A239JNJ3_EKHLU|nr:peroxiredoxin [Ekhidna lutea]SNT06913.1 peroxiredoxin (alkyl hydroperoxide reductase subunit C) [Ekhidna lutea]
MSLVGKKAPIVNAPAVINGEEIVENFSLDQYIGKKEVMFFFYPKDFTFVCPTEIHAFQEKLEEFEKRGVAVVGASCDTEETHLAWLMTDKDKGGISGVTYPLVADPSKTVASNFGVLAGDWAYDEEGNLEFDGAPVAFRGTFFIDKEGVVRHETINDLPLGRNIDEMLRIVDAWHHVEKHGEVCPANWEEGKTAMNATREGVAEYLSAN